MKHLLVATALLLGSQAYADLFTSLLEFHAAPQSFWGPGASPNDFYYHDRIGGAVGIDYELGANSGTVTADAAGNLNIEYAAISTPNPTLGISLAGLANGGHFSTTFGAWVDIDGFVHVGMPWPIPDLDFDWNLFSATYNLDVNEAFTPTLGGVFSGDDRFTAAGVGAGVGSIGAYVDLDIEQNSDLRLTGLDGWLRYTHRDTGFSAVMPFDITGNLENPIAVDLNRTGIWDVEVFDLALANSFRSEFDLNIGPTIDYIVGSWHRDLLGVEVHDTGAFGLDFNTIGRAGTFSIMIVPEPTSMALLVGALGLLGFSRRGKGIRTTHSSR